MTSMDSPHRAVVAVIHRGAQPDAAANLRLQRLHVHKTIVAQPVTDLGEDLCERGLRRAAEVQLVGAAAVTHDDRRSLRAL